MTEQVNLIPARLKSAVVGGHVAGADQIIDDNIGKTQNTINAETNSKFEQIDNEIEGFEKQDVVPVDTLPDVATADPKKVYRVVDETTYTDYMVNATGDGWKKIYEAEFPGIDDVPTDGSENLVKSGGVAASLKSIDDKIISIDGGDIETETDAEIIYNAENAALGSEDGMFNVNTGLFPNNNVKLFTVGFNKRFRVTGKYTNTWNGTVGIVGLIKITTGWTGAGALKTDNGTIGEFEYEGVTSSDANYVAVEYDTGFTPTCKIIEEEHITGEIERLNSIIETSVNLMNPATITQDAYLTSSGNVGSFVSTPKSIVTDFIPFTQEMGSLIASVDGCKASCGNGYICLYAANKETLVSSVTGSKNKIDWVSGTAYARFTFIYSGTEKLQVQAGNAITNYVPYGNIFVNKNSIENGDILNIKALKYLGDYSLRYEFDELASSFADTIFPIYLKGRSIVLFEANLSTVGEIVISRAVSDTESVGDNGWHLHITSSSLQFVSNSTNTTYNLTNTISTFVKVKIEENKLFNALIVSIMTLSGLETTTFNISNGLKGNIRVSTSTTITSVKLSISNKALKEKVWIFGDSYLDFLWSAFHILTDSSMLINGYGGINNAEGYSDLIKCLKFSSPKIIVWTLGLNDTEDDIFKDYVETVYNLCIDNGITPIFYAQPTIPTRLAGKGRKTWLKSKGYRFIDADSAVGADSQGVWYEGYINTDNIHPSLLGSNAIFMQYMIDAPEICNFESD